MTEPKTTVTSEQEPAQRHTAESPLSSAPREPQLPQLGALGMARWAWRQLTSMRTALFLLLQFLVRPLVARRLRRRMEALGLGGQTQRGGRAGAPGIGGGLALLSRVQEALRRRGHVLKVAERNWSSAQVIAIDPKTGWHLGATDPRSDGAALGY